MLTCAFAGRDLANTQPVGIRMLPDVNDFADHDTVKVGSLRLNRVDFVPGHREAMRQRLRIKCRVNPFT